MAKNDHSTRVGNVLAHIRRREPGGIVAAKAVSRRLVEIPTFANAYASPRIGRQNAVTANKLQCTAAHSREWPRSDVGKLLAHIECREVIAVVSNHAHCYAEGIDDRALVVLEMQRYYITHSSGQSSPLHPGDHTPVFTALPRRNQISTRTTYLKGVVYRD